MRASHSKTFNFSEVVSSEMGSREREAQIREIAEHVSAILRNPATPDSLYDGIIEGMHVLDDDARVHERPAYVEAILLCHYEGEEQEANG